MEFAVLVLLIILLAPKVFPVILAALGVVLLVLIPAKIMANSVVVLFNAPRSLFKTAFNRRLRVNHALEHATVNVLEEKYNMKGLAGLALPEGFRLFGYDMPPPELIYRAASEGLERMRNGEKNLAIHTRCGTSILVTQLLVSLVYIVIIVWRFRAFNAYILPYFLLGLVLVNFVSRPLGKVVQRLFTTNTNVKNVTITEVSVEEKIGNPVLKIFRPVSVIVHTRRNEQESSSSD